MGCKCKKNAAVKTLDFGHIPLCTMRAIKEKYELLKHVIFTFLTAWVHAEHGHQIEVYFKSQLNNR